MQAPSQLQPLSPSAGAFPQHTGRASTSKLLKNSVRDIDLPVLSPAAALNAIDGARRGVTQNFPSRQATTPHVNGRIEQHDKDERLHVLYDLLDAGVTGLADCIADGTLHIDGPAMPPIRRAPKISLTSRKSSLTPIRFRTRCVDLLTFGRYTSPDRRRGACLGRRRWWQLANRRVSFTDGSGSKLVASNSTRQETGYMYHLLMTQAVIAQVVGHIFMLGLALLVANRYGGGADAGITGQGVWARMFGFDNEYSAAATTTTVIGFCMILLLVCIEVAYRHAPRVVGTNSTPGALPTLLPCMLQATAPEYMVSYSWTHPRLELVRGLGELLPDCWMDIDRLVSGSEIPAEIVSAAAHCRCLIIFLTPQYLRSPNCCRELASAVLHRQLGYHQTIVLVDNPSSTAVLVPSPHLHDQTVQRVNPLRALSELQEANRGIQVQPSAPNWPRILELLSENCGFTIVHNPADLLDKVMHNAANAPEQRDAVRIMNWWSVYGRPRDVAGGPDVRYAWQSTIQKSFNKRTFQPSHLCEWITRIFVWLKPPPDGYISSGNYGQWIAPDGSRQSPHYPLTSKVYVSVSFWILFLTPALSISICAATSRESPPALLIVYVAFTAILCWVSVYSLSVESNAMFPASRSLHSKALLPLYVSKACISMAEEETVKILFAEPKGDHRMRDTFTSLLTFLEEEVDKIDLIRVDAELAGERAGRATARRGHAPGRSGPNDLGPDPYHVHCVEDLLASHEQGAAPRTIYVLALTTKAARDAWRAAVADPHAVWPADQMVLISTDAAFSDEVLDGVSSLRQAAQGIRDAVSALDQSIMHKQVVNLRNCFEALDAGGAVSLGDPRVLHPDVSTAVCKLVRKLGAERSSTDGNTGQLLMYPQFRLRQSPTPCFLSRTLSPLVFSSEGLSLLLSQNDAAISVPPYAGWTTARAPYGEKGKATLSNYLLLTVEGTGQLKQPSPYSGIVAAVLDAVGAKIPVVLTASGEARVATTAHRTHKSM